MREFKLIITSEKADGPSGPYLLVTAKMDKAMKNGPQEGLPDNTHFPRRLGEFMQTVAKWAGEVK